MLSRFKISFPELRKAILELDESVISIEGAGALAEYGKLIDLSSTPMIR